jgi:LuxR family transcriptional regulator, maltose regulon positive regulatory protein
LLGDVETGSDRPAAARPPATARPVNVVSGGLLTAKESEVLRLLTNGLPNKLIARTMDISDETVKWHLKNLFSKLNAGSRKHAVDRARLLGLIA